MWVFIGALDWIRTSCNQIVGSLSLYPTGLQAHMKFLKVILRLRGRAGHGTCIAQMFKKLRTIFRVSETIIR